MSSSSKPDSKGRENNKKAKQRRKKRSGNATPVTNPSGPSTPAPGLGEDLSSKGGKGAGFGGEDYVAFAFSDPSDDEDETSFHVDAKGKGKAREYEGGPAAAKSGRDDGRDGDSRSRKRDRDDEGDRNPFPRREREWDRGKRGRSDRDRDRVGSTKQYEMVFEFDDLQRFDPYSSKKAPWVVDIEWEDCKNVAEMCVPYVLVDGREADRCSGYTGKSMHL